MVDPLQTSRHRRLLSASLVVCCLLFLSSSAERDFAIPDSGQAEFVQQLESYEVTIPARVSANGQHLSHFLHPGRHITKRSVGSSRLHYEVQVENRTLRLQLTSNDRLVSSGLVIERRRGRFQNVSDAVFSTFSKRGCHYVGRVNGETNSAVAVGTCNGLIGFVRDGGSEYFIEPIKGSSISPDGKHLHLIYKRSALPEHMDVRHSSQEGHKTTGCGVTELHNSLKLRENWEKLHQRKRDTEKRRRKRSISTEKHVETMVVVDPVMMKYYQNEDIETYVLTVMNMVSTLFHDASIGNAVNIVLVRIVLLEEAQKNLVITHHADKSLHSFCKWQKQMNFNDDDHPNHHDVAILLTRHNICSRMNEPCSTLGLAQVAGMCQPHRTCNINEDTGLALAYTVAHELGHNFGMKHDTSHNKCNDLSNNIYIMAPQFFGTTQPKMWSACSRKAITQFFDRDWGYCLDDEPMEHQFEFPILPPGTMYDADHQCRLQYGPEAAICDGIENLCSYLWCRVDNKCSTKMEAAAEGTICGSNKWCFDGKCVMIGDRPQAINGEWGEWGEWSTCSRSCGAGVSFCERLCNNPPPHYGGKYCIGERKRYRICSTELCAENTPSFRHMQCAGFNTVKYKKKLYEWEPVPIRCETAPCQLHCKPQNLFFSVLLKDMVTDGTPCSSTGRDMCISGRCRHIGCDWVIDSDAKEDRCGVCHGDASTCKMIKEQFNETKGVGYVEATVIPAGARSIRAEEVAEANNYLALRNNKGEYYLNGHWFIQWSGDYEMAGTIVHYQREGNLESFNALGPLKEPLHIMLLIQSENPGVVFEYTVPNENATQRIPEFSWEHTDWSHCTASCGGGALVIHDKYGTFTMNTHNGDHRGQLAVSPIMPGTQRSIVVCTEKEAGIVDDMYCNASAKADDKQRTCNEHLCPARWWNGPWQHCSATCGDKGVHRRTVICVRSLGPDEQMALEDLACDGQPKPIKVEPCPHTNKCPPVSKWITEPWTDTCYGNPCGWERREVYCEDPKVGCEKEAQPVESQRCSNISCGYWTFGGWSSCTRSCGEGVQYRKVTCLGGRLCDLAAEPKADKTCNMQECPASTTMSSTTRPPETTTEQRRAIHFIHSKNLGGIVEDSHLGGSENNSEVNFSPGLSVVVKKASSSNRSHDHKNNDHIAVHYQSRRPSLSYRWLASGWTKCSRMCGRSNRTRTVTCVTADMNHRVVGSRLCPAWSKPFSFQKCKKPCLHWQMSDWSECSVTCGRGKRHRRVKCLVKNQCDSGKKPKNTSPCQVSQCAMWVSGAWSQCSKTCGKGNQVRLVQCVNITSRQRTEVCNPAHKPDIRQKCELERCPKKKEKRCNSTKNTALCRKLRMKGRCSHVFVKSICCKACKNWKNTPV